MKLKQINKSKGFTIIETLIVLAIAATIFLVVFLAVTALNRSSRNTQRKDDAAAVVAGMSEYAGNNSGILPTEATAPAAGTPDMTLCNTAGCAETTDAKTQVKLGYYNAVVVGAPGTAKGTVYLVTNGTGLPAATASDVLDILVGATCTNGTTASYTNGSSRSVAAVYGIESSGGFSWQCEAS